VASGKSHAAASIASAIVLSPIVASWKSDIPAGLMFAVGNLCGVILSPDLDQQQKTISEAIISRIPIIGWLFWLYFLPYAWIFPHRSPLTHLPVLGTIIRLVYLIGPIFIFLFIFANDQLYHLVFHVAPPNTQWFLFGLCTSDTLHWINDGMPLHGFKN